jgi:hypothetical protein
MVERDGAKRVANKSGCTSDWLTYCKFTVNGTMARKSNSNQMAYSSQNHLMLPII